MHDIFVAGIWEITFSCGVKKVFADLGNIKHYLNEIIIDYDNDIVVTHRPVKVPGEHTRVFGIYTPGKGVDINVVNYGKAKVHKVSFDTDKDLYTYRQTIEKYNFSLYDAA